MNNHLCEICFAFSVLFFSYSKANEIEHFSIPIPASKSFFSIVSLYVNAMFELICNPVAFNVLPNLQPFYNQFAFLP